MTNEIDTIHEGALAPTGASATLANLEDQARSWSAASQIAEQLARTDFAGPFKGKPADLTAAILKGAEVGIPPASIGKSIYVVHGVPALYGKASLAIALRHGYVAETIEDTPQAVTVRMTSPAGQSMDVRYTIERAEAEGLVKGNAAQYKARPSKMLYWKCIGELTDRMIPHLTGGMPVVEDWQQSPAPVRVTSTRVDSPAGPDVAKAALGMTPTTGPDPAPTSGDLRAALDTAGIEADERKSFLEARVGRDLGGLNDLTGDEIAAVINFLQNGEPA